jgi:hypothetical protein
MAKRKPVAATGAAGRALPVRLLDGGTASANEEMITVPGAVLSWPVFAVLRGRFALACAAGNAAPRTRETSW